MKLNDLRIGNIVCCTDDPDWSPMTIVGINYSGEIFVKCEFEDGSTDTNDYEIQDICSILLTEKILSDLDIKKSRQIHNNRFSGIVKVNYNSFIGQYEFRIGKTFICFIETVNQLQNVFHSITGEELRPE